MAISTLDEYLKTIPNDDNRARMVEVLNWVAERYPELELRIAWNQPMFTHHGTYIIGFSAASKHMAMAPERATMIRFEPVMREHGTDFGTMFARQPWNKPFDYELLDAFIQHQLAEHALAAAEAVASGAQPPVVHEFTEDDDEWLRATVLPALEHYLAHPESAHSLEEFDALIKQTVHDYEEHPDDVCTLDEVKAELGLD